MLRQLSFILGIVLVAIITAVALDLAAGGRKDSGIGHSVTRNGITVTLQSSYATQTDTTLGFLISGLPSDSVTGSAVDIVAGGFRYNGEPVEGPRISNSAQGRDEVSLQITFDTAGSASGEFEVGRIFVKFSDSIQAGDDRAIDGPWSFRFRDPDGLDP